MRGERKLLQPRLSIVMECFWTVFKWRRTAALVAVPTRACGQEGPVHKCRLPNAAQGDDRDFRSCFTQRGVRWVNRGPASGLPPNPSIVRGGRDV